MSAGLSLIGVGPGDPELMTLKAARCIAEADVVVCLGAENSGSMALEIVRAHVGPMAKVREVDMPMRVDPVAGQAIYDGLATEIFDWVGAGQSVVYLCEGDPLFYGSAIQLLRRLADRIVVQIVPGVTSLTASAAAAVRPLAVRNEIVRVLPAPLDDSTLGDELARPGVFAIIKVGRHLQRVAGLLERLGLADDALIVEYASGPKQRVMQLSECGSEDGLYFSTILCRNGGH